jgi:hypothetical protein
VRAVRRAWTASDSGVEEFVAAYQPALSRHRLEDRCVVGGGTCQRRRRSNHTGLCHAHTTQWNRRGRRAGLGLARWAVEVARPLPPRTQCAVADCLADSRLDIPLCGEHVRLWRADQTHAAEPGEQAVRVWATGQSERPQINQFDLSGLAATLRWELLYVLQQRDNQGQRLDPAAVRQLSSALADMQTVAGVPYAEVERRLGRTPIVHSYARSWSG